MPQHQGRVAVITSGASGIGLAAAERFASIGMKLVLADLSEDALDKAATQLAGAELVTVPTDISKIDEVERLKDRAYAAFGAVDVLMNNAGTSPAGGPFDHYERWQRVLGVNLWDVINGAHAFAQAMIDQNRPGCDAGNNAVSYFITTAGHSGFEPETDTRLRTIMNELPPMTPPAPL